ncbi:MFS transporter [Psychromarinibacter sp. S121]|uniref:MFS transporter n=1 Tax=Psychromarinibacter sp. S121 TaxID=3415127 RepID=UPI003C7C36B0
MSILTALRISRAPAAGLMSVGILWGSFAAMVPDIKARVDASDGELGGALLMSALGGLIAMWSAPKVTGTLGRYAMPLFGICVCFVVLLPMFPQTVVALGACLFAMGLTVALLDISSNLHISGLEARHKMHLMNVNHAMYSFAFAGAAWVSGIARRAGLEAAQILPAMAFVCVLLVLLMRVPRTAAPVEEEAPDTAARLPWGAIALTGVILFAGFIGENATEAWSALHIERTLGGEHGQGSFGPATLGLVMGIGRLSGQLLSARLGDARLIFWSAVLGVIGALTIAAAPSVPVVLIGVAITGMGMAVVVPSVTSLLGARVTERMRSYAMSRAWMLGIVGFFVGPSMIGGIAELFGLRFAFVAVSIIIAVILPAIWALAWREPKTQAA